VVKFALETILEPTRSRNLVRFGTFELDLQTRELRKNQLNTGLPEQSVTVLAMLIERPGELVPREAIRNRLWPNDTIVEFDHSINAAIRRLRQVLEDSADTPQYIETLARRGYRWMVPVDWVEAQGVNAGYAPPEARAERLTAAEGNLIGKKVSHYRVLTVLGGGGMGVVYEAEDLKLGRRVALKFLPEELASDSAALKRFESEACAASALNHPNICTIYEVEEHEGLPFLVMELLEGQTLRDLISASTPGKPGLDLQELLGLSAQITAGLEAAHQQGIIHRDIKPANIFVTSKGQAKILDFGLAKLFLTGTIAADFPTTDHREGGSAHEPIPETESLTASSPFLSRTGVAMGTAGYMSPEQVRGEKLDARTDLFSFGLVLYEMATGQRPFQDDTAVALHDAILNHTPAPARELNPQLPSKLEAIIHRALEKEREARYQTALEMRTDLEGLQRSMQPELPSARWRRMVAASAAVLIVAAGIFWYAKRPPTTSQAVPDLKLRQLTSNSSENRVLSGAISPDGKYLAYSDVDGMSVKVIDTGEIRRIPEAPELAGKSVDWQVMGAWLAGGTHFVANAHAPGKWEGPGITETTSIWVASILGGPPKKLRDKAVAYNASPDGLQIAFGIGSRGDAETEIWLVGPDGEDARKFLEAEGDGSITAFNWMPDGQRISYIKIDVAGEPTGVTRDLHGGPLTIIFPPAEMKQINEALLMPDGRLVYAVPEPGATGDTCNYWVRRIDPRTGARLDTPRRLMNWTGSCLGSGSVSADGKRLAFLGWSNHNTVSMTDLEAGGKRLANSRHFILDESFSYLDDWTADNKAVIFTSNRTGHFAIYRQSYDQDTPELIAPLTSNSWDLRLSPDNKWILFFPAPTLESFGAPAKAYTLMRLPITGGTPEVVLEARPSSLMFCAGPASKLCVIAEPSEDRKLAIVTAFDPLKGRGAEIARFDIGPEVDEWNCDISYDGTRLAFIQGPEGPIQILSLPGQVSYTVTGKGLNNMRGLNWTADGKGLLVSRTVKGESSLLHVDLSGKTDVLWKNNSDRGVSARPSPDGRHLAVQENTFSSNMWMMENF
jgi:serine/threonine protein kinase